jgi:competence protein ComEC
VESETQIAKTLNNTVENKEIREILAKRGMIFDLGDEIKLKVLFPDRNVSKVESNTASIVAKLEYGSNSFLLTGDSPKSIEKYLVFLDGSDLKSNVLKAGHHGSKTSSSEIFLNNVLPEIVIISAGEDNRYGHPHQEVLDLLTKTEVFETSDLGSIFFLSDGEKVWLK